MAGNWLRSRSLAILCLVVVATGSAFARPFPASDSSDSSAVACLPKTGNHVSASGPTPLRDAKLPTLNSHSDERGRLDLRTPVFIENQGQFDERVRFRIVGNGASLWLTDEGIVFDFVRPKDNHKSSPREAGGRLRLGRLGRAHDLQKSESPELERIVFSQKLVGASSKPVIEAKEPLPGTYNYFMGSDPAKWRTHVRAFREIVYRDVWQGIDLKLFANRRNLEQEFIVHPGADPAQVRLAYEGIKKLDLAKNGSLQIHTEFGNLTETQPRLYQQLEGKRVAVKGRFRVSGDSYTFDVGHRNKELALVIDPTLLYSTFLGGSAGFGCGPFSCAVSEQASAIAVDSSGSAYVTGFTQSLDFPVTVGAFQSISRTGFSAFVTKLNPTGDQLVYSTYFGSPEISGQTHGLGIAVNAANEAYVTGFTIQSGTFPTTPNAFQATCRNSASYFFTKLSAAGDGLAYSTCFGSIAQTQASAIAIDSSGKAYITGGVANGNSIPVTASAFQSTNGGGINAFLTVFSPFLSGTASLVYSTYLGGNSNDQGEGVAVDSQGNAYVAGFTTSPNFPVTPGAFKTTYPGATVDLFVAKFNPAASGAASLIYSTFLGGTTAGKEDFVGGIAVDQAGAAYVAGDAQTLDFPVTPGAFQTVTGHPGKSNAFVTKLSPTGNSLIYSTLFSGKTTGDGEFANAIALDSSGDAYITGSTNAPDLPTTPDAFQPAFHPQVEGGVFFVGDVFIAKFDPTGSKLIYSSYLGGGGSDTGLGIVVDQIGDAYITGFTTSTDFPVTSFAFQPTANLGGAAGPADAFVAKLSTGATQKFSVAGIAPDVGGNAGTVSPQIAGTGFHAGTSVKLNCGQVSILGTNSLASAGGRFLRTTFDLAALGPGICDLIVTNPDGVSVTLLQAFTVQQGGAPNVHIYKVGTVAQKPPADQPTWPTTVTYYITVTNTGNVDSTAVHVSEALEPEFSLSSITPPAETDIATSAEDSLILWNIPILAPGESLQFTYSATIDPVTPVGSTVVGGPACFLLPVNLSQFSACVSSNPNTVVQCGVALAPCTGAALATCSPVIPLGGTKNPFFNPAFCSQALHSCVNTMVSCGLASTVSSCLQQASQSCSSYIQQLLGGPLDPNYLSGPAGLATQRWILGGESLSYVVGFGNEATATAPAQQVTVTQPLDNNLDLSTVKLLGITVPTGTNAPSLLVSIPSGGFNPAANVNEFITNVDLRPEQDLLLTVDATLNLSTRVITWSLTSIDPTTGQPPTNAGVGFLPPGAEASLAFTGMPIRRLPSATAISEQGSVVFSNSGIDNAPVSTNRWTNTIDNAPPVSQVTALPANESSTTFNVEWSGTDIGAGVQDFSIFVSDNGGPFTSFQSNTAATSVTFTGVLGHTYGFYSIARDLVGNIEGTKTVADTTTTISTDAIPPTTLAVLAPAPNANGWNNSNVTVNLSATDNPGGSGVQQITFSATGAQPIASTNAAGSSASVLINTEGLTNFNFFATDLAANVEPGHTATIRLDKTPPSITGARTPVANANGWSNTDVTVSFACSDALSGLAPGSPPGSTLVSSEGVNQQVPGVCLDLAGNPASTIVSGINIDKTSPTITPSRAPMANANGWNNTNVTVSFACADALSGVAAGSPPAPTVLSGEGTNQQVSGTCQDLAGNSAAATATGINIDKTPPVLSALPAANCTLWPPNKKFVTVATISAADVLSGLASFSVEGTSNEPMNPNDPDIIITGTGLGPRTVQLRADRLGMGTGRVYTINTTATDAAGNTVNATSTCTVPHDQAP